jgi:flagellar hook-associated protein 1 FlgK
MENAPLTSDGQFGFELFTRNFCDRYNVQTIDGQEYYVRNDVNTFGNASTYTIMNLSVNEDIIQDYSRIPLTTQAGLDDYEKAEQLVSLFSKKLLKYNDRLESLNFEMFYESIVNDLANTGKVYQSMSDNEDVLTHQLDSQRLEVMGVSSEEELSNMIKYQQAYNASSRYVNVIDSMLQTLIMQMGAG